MATTKNKKPTATETIIKLKNEAKERTNKHLREIHDVTEEARRAVQRSVKEQDNLIDEIRTIARKHGMEKIMLGETLNRLDGALSFAKSRESQIKEQDQQIKLLVRNKENADRTISDLSSKLKERDGVIHDLSRGIKALHREHVGPSEGWTTTQLFDSLNNAFIAKRKEANRDRGETAFRRYVHMHVMIGLITRGLITRGQAVEDMRLVAARKAERILSAAEEVAKGS